MEKVINITLLSLTFFSFLEEAKRKREIVKKEGKKDRKRPKRKQKVEKEPEPEPTPEPEVRIESKTWYMIA